MSDKIIVCKDCNAEFVFSEGEQSFYKERGFNNEPQRCSECRKARKNQRRSTSSFGFGGHRGGNKGISARW